MKKLIILFLVFFINIGVVYAASASLSVSSSSIENGKKVTATVTLKGVISWNVKITSSGATSGCTEPFSGVQLDGKNVNKTFKVTCPSTSTGVINFTLSGDIFDNNKNSVKVSASKTVNVVKPHPKSTNNKLKGLSVEGYELSPKFDASVNEYTVNVPSTVDKIKIEASKQDSYASISGTGEKEVSEGANTFEVVCKSETGVGNVYKVIVNVADQNPINVSVSGTNYTVVKEPKNLNKPDLFEETTITIGDISIPAFKNEATGYTLVGLKNSEGKIKLFIYEDNKYLPYNENVSSKVSLVILDPIKLYDYEIKELTINEEKVKGYEIDGKLVVYGINLENGKKNFYTYEKGEKTFQLFDEKSLEKPEEFNLDYVYLGTILLLIIIIIIILVCDKKKFNRFKEIIIEQEEKMKSKKKK